jgi:prepilin-type N-terminal cleavage/methylation domain-containing protein
MKNKQGFTLIELLVVIAIIGVLATIVLTSLSKTQGRSYDAKIKEQLNGFRTSAQLYFTNHGSYGPATNDCSQGMFNDLTAQDGSPAMYIAAGSLPDFSIVTCNTSLTQYALKATLYSGDDYWCVDSNAVSKTIHGTPDNNTFCP